MHRRVSLFAASLAALVMAVAASVLPASTALAKRTVECQVDVNSRTPLSVNIVVRDCLRGTENGYQLTITLVGPDSAEQSLYGGPATPGGDVFATSQEVTAGGIYIVRVAERFGDTNRSDDYPVRVLAAGQSATPVPTRPAPSGSAAATQTPAPSGQGTQPDGGSGLISPAFFITLGLLTFLVLLIGGGFLLVTRRGRRRRLR